MCHAHRVSQFFFAVLGLMLVSGGARGVEFRNAASGFSLQTPDNWVRFAPGKLAMMRQGAAMRAGADLIIHEGFEPAGLMPEKDGSTCPFMAVHEIFRPWKRKQSYDEIEKLLNTDFRRGFEQGGQFNTKLGPITLDRAKNRFHAEFEMTLPNGLKLQGKLFGFLGKDSIILLQYVTRARDFGAHQAMFDRSADTFQFDPGFQYRPPDNTLLYWVIGGIAGTLCCMLIVILAVFVMLFMLIGKKGKKKKKKRRRYD